jgi:hypothetical protein
MGLYGVWGEISILKITTFAYKKDSLSKIDLIN